MGINDYVKLKSLSFIIYLRLPEECRYFINLYRDLNYTDSETSITLKDQIVEVISMLNAYSRALYDSKKS